MKTGRRSISSISSNKKKLTVFYAWQSDLPSTTNRTFIENCLGDALNTLNEQAVNYEFALLKDTSGEIGSPGISETILGRIKRCYIFIGDVTIVNSDQSGRLMPNPNVFFECGFAVSAMGWERVILLANTAFCDLKDIPFDVHHQRIATYDYKVPNLLCVDNRFALNTEACKKTPHILTKEDGVWKFYIANVSGQLEDHSSLRKYKAFLQRLNKTEANVNPSTLRGDWKKELMGIINESKQSAKKSLTKLFVNAIGDIHNEMLIKIPKQSVMKIVHFLVQHRIDFLDEAYKRRYRTVDQLLLDLATRPNRPETIKFRLCASSIELQKHLGQIPQVRQYLKIQQVGAGTMTLDNMGGWAYHYEITFLPDLLAFYKVDSPQIQTAHNQETPESQHTPGTQSVTSPPSVSGHRASLMPGDNTAQTAATVIDQDPKKTGETAGGKLTGGK